MNIPSVFSGSKSSVLAGIIWAAVTLSLSAQDLEQTARGSEQSFSGLSVKVPTSLSRTSELGLGNPAPRSEITYQGDYQGIAITVSVAPYKGDPNQLDKNIEEFMGKLSKVTGVTEEVHTIREVTLEGAVAKRVSLNMVRADKVLRGQFLYVISGDKIWCVQTIYQNTTPRGDIIASGIIASAKLKSSETMASAR